jgi:hypothetical protein
MHPTYLTGTAASVGGRPALSITCLAGTRATAPKIRIAPGRLI